MKNDPYPTKQTADNKAHRQSLPIWGDLEGYYHPDHLGSSSWITDQTGEAIQHLQYLPFGEQYVDQRRTGWDGMFTFSGKERDAETGYSYFGARYYDSDLSIWLSVDPLAHASPHQSPYVYCSNNPIRRIDPTGMIDGDFYDFGGNYLGTDGKNDNKVYIVDENSVKDKVTPKNASEAMGKVKVETTYQELNEANEVYGRTAANGGNKEESSVVLDGVTVVHGPQGDDITKGEKTSSNLPSDRGNDRTVSIHSHLLGGYSDGNALLYQTPESPIKDSDMPTFKNYDLNIIVGNSGWKMNPTTNNMERTPQAVFYNKNTESLGGMSLKALQGVLSNGKNRGRF